VNAVLRVRNRATSRWPSTWRPDDDWNTSMRTFVLAGALKARRSLCERPLARTERNTLVAAHAFALPLPNAPALPGGDRCSEYAPRP
jgi:hypothetical protein